MDAYVQNKLSEYKLQNYIEIFAENEVDEEAFRILSESTIKELIPKAGPQTKFLKLWRSDYVPSKQPVENNISQSDLLGNALRFSINPGTVLPNLTDLELLNTSGYPESDISSSGRSLNFPIVSSLSEASYSGTSETTVQSSSKSTSAGPNLTPLTQNVTLKTSQHTTQPPLCIGPLPSLIRDIRTILRSSPEGVSILHSYESTGELNNHQRILLAGVIIAAEIQNQQEYRIDTTTFTELAEQIVKIFPKEQTATYFVPYRINKVTNQKILAKGKLYDKYCSYRKLLRQTGAISTNAKKRKNCGSTRPLILASRENIDTSTLNDVDYSERVQWLKTCVEPWPTVEQYWQDTSQRRIAELSATTDSSSLGYFETFKVLKQRLGHNLINIDFQSMYPQQNLALFGEWLTFKDEIIKYCKSRNNSTINNILSIIEGQNEDGPTEPPSDDTIVAAISRIIPLLLPCPSIKLRGKPAWRPSKSEVQQGFVLHVPSLGHLETELEKRRKKLLQHGLTEQPLPVFVGAPSEYIGFYVCVNDHKYEVQSALEGLDIAFKSFYALQLQYPREAQLPWIVIQSRLYGISGENDKVLPSVQTLVADLRQRTLSPT